MLENDGAGAGQDDGQGGSGAPSGGSPDGGSENDDKPITARQLKAALASQKASFEERLAAKDRELQTFKEGVGSKQEPAKSSYTKADLKAAAEAGHISQEQADDIWDRQRETQIAERAKAEALDAVAGYATKERIDADIAAYRRLKPEIMDEGSDIRQRIQEEFNAFVSMGMPGERGKNLPTQLAAIRAVLGPLDKLKQASAARRAQESEQQSGGAGEGQRPGSGKTLVGHLKGEHREYYERAIKSQRYKDWEAVEAELKFASPNARRRLGLPSA